jgi:hypothetical protein
MNIRHLCRRINDFKRGYQPRRNILKNENGDLLADSHNILNRWKNFYQLLDVLSVSVVGHIEMHTAEPALPDSSHFDVELAIAKFKSYKSPGRDRIPAELSEAVSSPDCRAQS